MREGEPAVEIGMHAPAACTSNWPDCGSAVCAMTLGGSHDRLAVEELLLQIPSLLLLIPSMPVPVRTLPV